jgi:hypothetical protein
LLIVAFSAFFAQNAFKPNLDMKKPIFCLLLAMLVCLSVQAQQKTVVWECTYLKALPGHKQNLAEFIRRNWFAMDSAAVAQGLMTGYKLLENSDSNAEWDFVVAVGYPQREGYNGVVAGFEKIRSQHKTVLVQGKRLGELGKIVKSDKLYEVN